MDITLREASLDDLDAVVEVFCSCWRESYPGVLPVPVIDAMSDERATALWRRVLSSDPTSVVVAERAGAVLGLTRFVVSTGAAEKAGAPSSIPAPEGMVHSLYVTKSAQGLGVGTRLLDHATATCAARGARVARVWAFAANAAALGFYRSHGWVPDGTTRIEDEFGAPEVRLWKALP